MAILGSAQELPDSPTGGGDLNQRHYTRKFRVVTDNKNTGIAAVLTAPGLPPLYSPYQDPDGTTDSYALLREYDAERMERAALQWVVTCNYKTPDPTEAGRTGTDTAGAKRETPGQQNDPQLQLPEIEISTEKFQQVVYHVYDLATERLTPCKNTAGVVFDPPPTKDASRMVITITRNEPITSPVLLAAMTYTDVCNSDAWWFALPGQAKVQSISPQRQTKQLTIGGSPVLLPYLRVVYKIEFRPDWDTLILDAGSWYLDDHGVVPNQKRQFKTDDNHPTVGALDGHGHALAEGATPVFLRFRFYLRKPFAALNLPTSFTDFA